MTFCTRQAHGNRPQERICQEMLRRFAVTPDQLRQHGGILNTAVYFADSEYKTALQQSAWQAPRQTPNSFVRFLDQQPFVISWYFEDPAHVAILKTATAEARSACTAAAPPCEGVTLHTWMAKEIAATFLENAHHGWYVKGKLDTQTERTPDAMVNDQVARCSSWSAASVGAALFANEEVIVDLGRTHMEPYWVLDRTPGLGKLWNLTFSEGFNFVDFARVYEYSNPLPQMATPADFAMALSINRILSSQDTPRRKHQQLVALKPLVESQDNRKWLNSALRLYVQHLR